MVAARRLAVIVTALPIERKAVVEHLRDVTEVPPLRGSIYRRGVFDERSEPWDVIVAEIGAGNANASAEAERVIAEYSPQVAVFVGIAGAIKDVSHGDVVASTKVYGYESGKDEDGGFRPRPAVQLSGYDLEQRARFEAGEDDWRQRIKGGLSILAKTPPVAVVGPIAAGEKVLASMSSAIYSFVRQTYGDALAVEMEGHGFLLGVHMNQPTQGIVVRSMSDRLSDKNEARDVEWQPVAARHAAAFAFQLLAKLPFMGEGSAPASSTTTPAQLVNVGDISGSNNNVTINQHQGVSVEALVRFVQSVAPDANAEIDAAAERLNAADLDIAIYQLTELKKRRWDTLKSRERFRVLANLGIAMERKGEFKQAARFFLEAKEQQPLDPSARAMEAIAYYHLDEKKKAYELADQILQEHPTCGLAATTRIRCAPRNASFVEIEQSVPSVLREDPEVMHALGCHALAVGDIAAAERLTRRATELHPQFQAVKEQLGTAIVQAENMARQSNRPVNTARLEDAVAALSLGLTRSRSATDVARLRYTRAGAYELLGKTEEAETDLRAAIENDKQDPDLVRRFALFLAEQERDDAAIEALLQADKTTVSTTNRLLLASLLGERNRSTDREDAAKLLRNTLLLSGDADPEVRAGVVETLVKLLACLGQHDEATRLLENLDLTFLTVPSVKAIRAGAFWRAGNKEAARGSAIEGLEAVAPDSKDADRLRVADALRLVNEKRLALTLWKPMLKPDGANVFVFMALECAKETGDDEYIFSFCKQLRAAGISHPYTIELEVLTQEKYGLYDDAIRIMQSYLTENPADELSRVFRVRLGLLGIKFDRRELIESDISKYPAVETVPVRIGAPTAYVLKNGVNQVQGVNYAYELVRHHFNDAPMRQAYFGIIGVGDDFDEHLPRPQTIAPGCAVKYKADDNGEEKWLIIEDGKDPQLDREEIGPDHLWAKDLSGKTEGDKFCLRPDPVQSRTATIEAIVSKYVYRKFEIINGWEDRFPGQHFARKYTSSTKEDGTPDISILLKTIELQEQHREEMHSLYREHPMSATTFAKLSSSGVLESLSHLAEEGTLPIRCCRGTTDEHAMAERALSKATSIVLDPSALATLFFSGQYQHLGLLSGKCVVCESTLDEYVELRKKFAKAGQGTAGYFKGKLLFRDDDPAERHRQQDRLGSFLDKLRSLVSLKSGRNLAKVEVEHRNLLIGLFGQPTAESIAEAAATGAALWTDDMAVAELAKAQGLVQKRLWSQQVFKSVAPAGAYIDLSIFLLQWRYFFTRLEPQIALAACRIASWDPNAPPLKNAIDWLSAPELMHVGAEQMGAEFLRLVSVHGPDIRRKASLYDAVIQALLKRPNGRFIVASMKKYFQLLFRFDSESQQQLRQIIFRLLDEQQFKEIRVVPGQLRPDADLDLNPKQRAERRKANRKLAKKTTKKK
jgi:nucleoside phosphorylase/tetratricopeptide (TPR) repeat protein